MGQHTLCALPFWANVCTRSGSRPGQLSGCLPWFLYICAVQEQKPARASLREAMRKRSTLGSAVFIYPSSNAACAQKHASRPHQQSLLRLYVGTLCTCYCSMIMCSDEADMPDDRRADTLVGSG